MADSYPTVRIFISSPGDVTEERDGARRVIESLQRLYPGTTLQPVLWEQLALPVTASFQETIDFLLEREPIDIAVFILWSRLGSPLGAAITRPDGTPYRSGTERELDLMLSAFEQTDKQRPVLLAYVRDDDSAFKEKLTASPTSDLEEMIHQRKLADAFIREQFQDSDGHNLRAYQTYQQPVGFVQRLRLHLRQAIDDLLGTDAAPSWTEEPYRGLEVFDVDHAAIFHGRDEETCQLLQRLRDQEQAGCAFVVIVGASGSGKSSLARAGVAAGLVQHAGDDDTKQWREVTFMPALGSGNLLAALVRSIAEALPELKESAGSLDDVAESLKENAAVTIRLSIAAAFSHAAEQAGGRVRMLIVLDQMEELWTDRNTTAEDREQFLLAIEALARSGHVAVLATLRSDFYHHAQKCEAFLRLKGKLGHFDLLPPDSASLQRLIAEPARLAGLQFERNEETGRSLDKVILEDAARDPGALPLLQYTLAELYRRRDESRRLLSFESYERLGGVEGALARRAGETLQNLPADAQAALDEILPLLVTVDVSGEQSAVRRRANVADLGSTPARKMLTEQLTAARFLTTDRQDEIPIASLAHEALLRRWDRIVDWIDANHDHLRRRARVEQTQLRWEQQDCDDSLLLAEGLPLDEGRQLLREAPYLLSEATADYIRASSDDCERKAARSRRSRAIVLTTIAGLLALIIVGGIYLRRATAAGRLVQGLLKANTSEVATIVEELAGYPILARGELQTAWAESADDSTAKLHAGLALIAQDSSVLPLLTERLLSAHPEQVDTIRKLLADHKGQITRELWQAVNADDPSQRLQAASALAVYDVDNDANWTAATPKIVQSLVRENAVHFAVWIKMLKPASRHLIDPIREVYRDKSKDREQTQVDLATELLQEYAAGDLDTLTELLLESEPKQFAMLFDEFSSHGDQAISRMTRELDAPQENTGSAVRQAIAATTLLRLGSAEPVIEVMQRDLEDLGPLSQFVNRCRAGKVSPQQLLTCLESADRLRQSSRGKPRKKLDRALYGILLSLGEYELDEIPPSDRDRLTSQLIAWYGSHPSSSVHGATGWLLRKWNFVDEVRRVDQTSLPFDESYERDWYVIAVDTPPVRGMTGLLGSLFGGKAERNEPEPIYFTMIVFPPGEFEMGAPNDEPSFQVDERRHPVRLTRALAVSDREVTWAQFDPFDQGSHHDMWERKDNHPRGSSDPVSAVSWFEAVAYCRWLTEQAGTSQCYSAEPLAGDTDPDIGWIELPASTPWPVDLDGSGFRLLTEAEWERVCRSGTRTAFSFGNDDRLLGDYGWFAENSSEWSHAVAQLRPNARGLFDLHGNVYEWCQDWYGVAAVSSEDPVGPDSGVNRVSRGGGWSGPGRSCRSSDRNAYIPTNRSFNSGFRVAMHPSVPSKPVENVPSE